MVLVTGATGVIGSYLIRTLLENQIPVRALLRENSPSLNYSSPLLEEVRGDILAPGSLHEAFAGGVKYVVHCAALISFWQKNYEKMRLTNVIGTANIVNFCLEYGVEKLVHISSVAALGHISGALINEKTPWDQQTSNYYGKTKYLAELEVKRGVEEGLCAVISCPCFVIGYHGRATSSARLFPSIFNGLKFYPPGSNGFIGAKDVALAILLLLKSPYCRGEKFLLCSENMSYQHLFTLIAQKLGVKPPFKLLPKSIIYAAAYLGEIFSYISLKEPLLTVETARTLTSDRAYDATLFRKTFSFSFQPIEEVVTETAQLFFQYCS
ncbi:MAG: NAD-dependent epimerase/dehydratase family protein [Bacteroidia bacterium]|nr:NAD-dependent epimerase/dehydratase family protein [Bacteroidia bacterium]MDW8158073.1 NAD-dependent epimerase/dehydratase family protein [Bacteroidia bacterium]